MAKTITSPGDNEDNHFRFFVVRVTKEETRRLTITLVV